MSVSRPEGSTMRPPSTARTSTVIGGCSLPFEEFTPVVDAGKDAAAEAAVDTGADALVDAGCVCVKMAGGSCREWNPPNCGK